MQIKLPPNYGFRYTKAFENIYIEMAKKKQITLIPFILDKIALDEDFMQPDGIHPNKKSQPKIAKIMYESIQLLINE
jgi:acyl-CoA thioesterase-1